MPKTQIYVPTSLSSLSTCDYTNIKKKHLMAAPDSSQRSNYLFHKIEIKKIQKTNLVFSLRIQP